MQDEERLCQCGENHNWGIVRHHQGVPIYGPRPTSRCNDFRQPLVGLDTLPISVDTWRRLENQGARTILDVQRLGRQGGIRRFGKKPMQELEAVFRQQHIKLTNQGSDAPSKKVEWRLCGKCGKKHRWTVSGYNRNGPLYNAQPTKTCKRYSPTKEVPIDEWPGKALVHVASDPTSVNLPTNGQELWAQTPELNAQATMATRLVVARLKELGKRKSGFAQIAAQWPEFMGFMISQVTDLRGSLFRDESKFAHLVAHTDELVETMRAVGNIGERLKRQEALLSELLDRLDDMELVRMEHDDAEDEALRHFGLVPDEQSQFDEELYFGGMPSRHDEPVLVEKANGRDDDDQQQDDNGNGDSESDSEEDDEEET